MAEDGHHQTAVDALESLGLKQYEAECFVALTRLHSGTAKEVSDIADVPRTRVYDAVRELSERGLVETRNSQPREYRAIPIEEAVETFRKRYASRTSALRDALETVESTGASADCEDVDVWSICGADGVGERIRTLVADAEDDVALAIAGAELLPDRILDALADAEDRGVAVRVATGSVRAAAKIRDDVPAATVLESDAEWLAPDGRDADLGIGRLLAVDDEVLLVSGVHSPGADEPVEAAVSGSGEVNGLVLLGRHALSTLFDRDA